MTKYEPLGKDCMLSIDEVKASILKYHNTTKDGEHTRFRSWKHCHTAFQKFRNDPTKHELLSLHLAYYLASWGMLRNSFLRSHDYLVHLPLVKVFVNGQFEKLYTEQTKECISLVLDAKTEINKAYKDNSPTDTLITKILLGVFGCTPAFDRYFIRATRKYGVSSGTFNENSLLQLWQYYEQHKKLFEQVNKQMGKEYTPMKLLDMCLWQIGFDENL